MAYPCETTVDRRSLIDSDGSASYLVMTGGTRCIFAANAGVSAPARQRRQHQGAQGDSPYRSNGPAWKLAGQTQITLPGIRELRPACRTERIQQGLAYDPTDTLCV